MEGINCSIQKALKADRMIPRPQAGPGLWVSFLLPVAMVLGATKTEAGTTYIYCATYSFMTFLNFLLLLLYIYLYQSTSVTKRINIFIIIPAAISIFLYTGILQLDLKQSLCYVIANALIYFEGISFLFKAFPKTFTFGEANIIIQAFSLFAHTLLMKVNQISVEGPSADELFMSVSIFQVALGWILVFCVVPFIHASLRQVKFIYFWGLTVLACIYLSIYWLLHCDLLFWIWNFLTKPERIGIIVLWLICCATAVVIVQHQISKRKKSNTILRKYFHILTTIVFLSSAFHDTYLIYFSSACVFCLFIVLEAFRVLKLPPLYEFLQNGFLVYSDEKDSGVLALTPICLLVGNALPFWLHPAVEYSHRSEHRVVFLSGVLSVGIGDTFASVGGKLFGKHFWKGSAKTIEGTVFCMLSQVLFVLILVSFELLQNSTEFIVRVLIAIFVTSVVEAKTDQIDNIVLPLTMYILLMFG